MCQVPSDDLLHSELSVVTDSPAAAPKPHLTGPAKPGVIRSRGRGPLSKLPPDSGVFDAFARLRKDGELSNEEAFVKLISNYDISLTNLNKVSSNVNSISCCVIYIANVINSAEKLPASFSKAKYVDIAPYAWLEPSAQGRDIRQLEIFRSRLPMPIFEAIYADVAKAAFQYGRMGQHANEEARSRYIASVSFC
jgi:hypothetical protein